ncbi:MAG: helix-turn-helix domain-containing protein, partial [archaeon]
TVKIIMLADKLEQLTKIGLTNGEAKVYLALLELESGTKTPIARISDVSSSKIYEVLDRLIRKGLVSKVKIKDTTHFKASEPNSLKDYILNEEKQILENKRILEEILPSLNERYLKPKERIDSEIYRGFKALENEIEYLINKAITANLNLITFFGSISNEINNKRLILFLKRLKLKRKNKNIKFKLLISKNNKSYVNIFTNKTTDSLNLINENTSSLIVFNHDTLLLITFEKNQPVTIKIENENIVNTFKVFIDLVKTIGK